MVRQRSTDCLCKIVNCLSLSPKADADRNVRRRESTHRRTRTRAANVNVTTHGDLSARPERMVVNLLPSLDLFEDRIDLSVADRAFERGVVLFVLVGVRDGESDERLVERVALPHVPADQRGIPGARVGERQRVAAALGEEGHPGRVEGLNGKLDLNVPELADVESDVPADPRATRGRCRSPAA